MPDIKRIAVDRIKPHLVLIKDKGVYLLPNIKTAGGSQNNPVFARGCDPKHDFGWQDQSDALLGSGSVNIAFPADWYVKALNNGAEQFRLIVDAETIYLG